MTTSSLAAAEDEGDFAEEVTIGVLGGILTAAVGVCIAITMLARNRRSIVNMIQLVSAATSMARISDTENLVPVAAEQSDEPTHADIVMLEPVEED